MKKRIFCFIVAFYIFSFTLCNCALVPVRAEVANIPVAIEMWEGFQTLFFSLGISLMAADATDKLATMDAADQGILDMINDLDTATADALKLGWNTYKENILVSQRARL